MIVTVEWIWIYHEACVPAYGCLFGAIKHHSIGTKAQETPQANAEDPQSSLVNVEVNIR